MACNSSSIDPYHSIVWDYHVLGPIFQQTELLCSAKTMCFIIRIATIFPSCSIDAKSQEAVQ